jgi:hypothetical protein
MPTLDQCLLCHDGLDEEKPAHLRAAAFFEDVWPRRGSTPLTEEVLFSHGAHAERLGNECARCHGDFVESGGQPLGDVASMSRCTNCHDQQGVDGACSTCHTRVNEAWPPATHASLWSEMHGDRVRGGGQASADRCDMCHSPASCDQCHREEKPRGHDELFRLRGHGILASLDRDQCAVCHRADSCVRCHQETRPISHRGTFGGTLSTHCFSCHLPLRNESCATCHRDAPSHALAAPQPPDHTPGADCRLCHGTGAPLPHVDNGSACAFCHR